MAKLRDHEPIIIDSFMGLWQRGDPDDTPLDHFQEAENLKFAGDSQISTRDGIGLSQDVEVPIQNIKRLYNYPTADGNGLIVLAINPDTGDGEIYHVLNSSTTYGPLLSIAGMTDFAFVPYAGRAYISPFTSYLVGSLYQEKGLENEFLYVYAGDGTAARKAAGIPISGNMTIANGAAGHTDAGFHLFGIVTETVSGYLSPPGALEGFTTNANFSVSFGSIPTSGDPNVVKRHLVATKVITSFNGDLQGYQYYFVPEATIDNNTDTFLNNVSFYDQDLLADASYLFDNFAEIAAGAWLSLYHNRLVVGTPFTEISIAYVSTAGEPEAINQISGIIAVTPDSNPLTNGQELRDLFYVFKRSKTVSFIDNGLEPAEWPMVLVDNALGCPVHGIATVLDTGSSNIDFLIVATYQGSTLFNGKFIVPELSWKIEALWQGLDRNDFRLIQIINAPIQKEIYIVLPDGLILVGNYSLGMDPKGMRWMIWRFLVPINTIAVVNIDEIILGSPLLSV